MKQADSTTNPQTEMSIGRRWLSFVIVLLVSILGSMVMFKASPLFPELMTDMGFTGSNIGLMMSMYTIIGIVLAFPAGGILTKSGFKWCLIIVCVSLIVGGALGAVATSVTMLLVSRFIEGIANGIIAVIAGAAAPAILPENKQGLGMGLSTIWFPGGAIIALNLAPALSAGMGWRGVWWFMTAIAVILFVMILLLFKVPAAPARQAGPEAATGSAPAVKPMWASIIVTSIVMACFGLVFGGAVGSFYPTFLQQAHGMDSQMAGFATSIINIVNVAFAPVVGIISDRFHTKKGLIVVGAAIMAVLYIRFTHVNRWYGSISVALGICNGFVSTGLYSGHPVLAATREDRHRHACSRACQPWNLLRLHVLWHPAGEHGLECRRPVAPASRGPRRPRRGDLHQDAREGRKQGGREGGRQGIAG